MVNLKLFKNRLVIFYIILGFSLFFILLTYIWNLTVDDAFISFRYALHLVEGYGLVWNIGETPVEGYSNFLWVLIFAVIIYLKLDPILMSKILGFFSVSGILFVYWKFLNDIFIEKREIAFLGFGITAALFLANPATVMHTVAGLETMLYVFLTITLFFCTYKIIKTPDVKYFWLFGIFSLLLSLLRFEGILLTISMIILLVLLKYRKLSSFKFEKSFIIPFIGLFVIPVSLYMIWRFQYFQELYPMSFIAKSIVPDYFQKFSSNIYSLYTFFMRILPFILVNLFLILNYKIFLTNKEIRKKYLNIILIFIVLFIVGNFIYLFTLLAMNYGDRLFYATYVFLYLITGISIALIFKYQDSEKTETNNKRKFFRSVLQVLMVLFLIFANTSFVPDFIYWHNYENQDMSTLENIGVSLQPFSTYNYTVATEYAGAVPYYSGWYHIDILGLNNHRLAGEHISIGYIRAIKPDLIILKFTSNQEIANENFIPLIEFAEENNYSIIKLPQGNFVCYLNPKIGNYNKINSNLNNIR